MVAVHLASRVRGRIGAAGDACLARRLANGAVTTRAAGCGSGFRVLCTSSANRPAAGSAVRDRQSTLAKVQEWWTALWWCRKRERELGADLAVSVRFERGPMLRVGVVRWQQVVVVVSYASRCFGVCVRCRPRGLAVALQPGSRRGQGRRLGRARVRCDESVSRGQRPSASGLPREPGGERPGQQTGQRRVVGAAHSVMGRAQLASPAQRLRIGGPGAGCRCCRREELFADKGSLAATSGPESNRIEFARSRKDAVAGVLRVHRRAAASRTSSVVRGAAAPCTRSASCGAGRWAS